MKGNDAARLARFALESGAFQFRPRDPVRWASGYLMPVYTDNRLILRSPRGRDLARAGLVARLESHSPAAAPWDAVAGTASAGIAPAVLLAESLKTGFLYVRSDPKGHGLQRRIEGLTREESQAEHPLKGKRVLLVEDLFSTGGSSAAAARALIEAGAEVPVCLAMFSYGFDRVTETFRPVGCRPDAVLTLDILLREAVSRGDLDQDEVTMIREWQEAPFEWGAHQNGPGGTP